MRSLAMASPGMGASPDRRQRLACAVVARASCPWTRARRHGQDAHATCATVNRAMAPGMAGRNSALDCGGQAASVIAGSTHHEYLLHRCGLRGWHDDGDHRAALSRGGRHGRRHERGPHRRLEFRQAAGLRAGAGGDRPRGARTQSHVLDGCRRRHPAGRHDLCLRQHADQELRRSARAGRPISATSSRWRARSRNMPMGRRSSWKSRPSR